MLKFGKIDAIQPETGRARVRFEDNDMVSDWIPLVVRKSKSDKDFHMFDVGDHVACTMDERCENGIIHGSIYDDTNKPTNFASGKVGIEFSNGSKIVYDRDANEYTIDITGGNVRMSAEKLILTGSIDVSGSISAQNIEVSGYVKAQGEITAKTTSLNVHLSTHMHPTAAPGSPSPPTPGT